MEKMTLSKELDILFKLISKNSFSIVALILLIVLAIIFITTNKKNARTTKNIYLAIYASIIIFVIVAYNKYILDFLDYMMNNLFIAIYFPNLAIYFAAIVISNIIVLVSIFNFKIPKLIKNINIIMYTIINFLLVLLIGVITNKKLDIYSQASIYKNSNAHALIELTSIVFIIWVLFLCIYKCIRIYQNNKYVETETVKVEKTIIEKPVIEERIVKERILPDNIVEVTIPTFAKQGNLEIELDEKEIEQRTNIEVEKRINTKLRESHVFDKMLTKRDYIILLNILKQSRYQQPLERLGEDKVEDDKDEIKKHSITTEETIEETTEEIVKENDSVEDSIEDEDLFEDMDEEDESLEIISEEEQEYINNLIDEEKESEKESSIEKTTEEITEETIEETIEEETVSDNEYYEEPRLIKIIEEDDQSSYLRLQQLYESVNL